MTERPADIIAALEAAGYKIVEDPFTSLRAGNDRSFYSFSAPARRMADEFPLSWDDAERLLDRMSKRFESWTGRSIEQHLAARPK